MITAAVNHRDGPPGANAQDVFAWCRATIYLPAKIPGYNFHWLSSEDAGPSPSVPPSRRLGFHRTKLTDIGWLVPGRGQASACLRGGDLAS